MCKETVLDGIKGTKENSHYKQPFFVAIDIATLVST